MLDRNPQALNEAMYRALAGSFVHSFLEWSAVCIAFFTVLLAFIHFHLQRDITTPIIGVSLCCAGIVDAFHALASDRLIQVMADNQQFIPFTWAISRIFNALIMIVGASLFLFRRERYRPETSARGLGTVLLISVAFGGIASGLIHVCATRPSLPETILPEALITHPWDIAPLLLFLYAGLRVFPRFYQRYPSLFSHALIVSILPQIATQLHSTFGSTTLFDSHFNIAYFLRIIAYLVPLLGLLLDYIRTYHNLAAAHAALSKEIAERERAQEQLKKTAAELARSNAELEQFAYVASHDLQEPLRKIQAFGDRLQSKCGEGIGERGRDYLERMQNAAQRMQRLINDLLDYSRVTSRAQPFTAVDLDAVIQEVLSDLEVRIEQTKAAVEVGDLPTLEADPRQMQQLLQNLLGNALKFHRPGVPPVVRVFSRSGGGEAVPPGEKTAEDSYCQIIVEDNGIGFEEKYLDRIFKPFQRLHGRSEYEGTGMGLAICHKIVNRHGGHITARSTPEQGTTFIVSLPLKQPQGEPAG